MRVIAHEATKLILCESCRMFDKRLHCMLYLDDKLACVYSEALHAVGAIQQNRLKRNTILISKTLQFENISN